MEDKNPTQNNINGDNIIVIYKDGIKIDIQYLQDIILNNKDKLISVIGKLAEKKCENKIDNSFITLSEKNTKNNLEKFYDMFIKKHESKFELIQEFIDDNDLTSMIDDASENLRMSIFSYRNRQSNVLTPDIFNELITEHIIGVKGEDKELIKLMLFFLYRTCYIGDK